MTINRKIENWYKIAAPFGTDNGIIYCAKNTANGKCYIGQTWVGLNTRKKRHFEKIGKKYSCFKFSNAMKKYGKNSFEWSILDYANSQDKLDELEIFYIKKFNSINNGYNLKSGGFGGRHSEESNEKNRQSNIEYWSSDNARIEHSKRHGAKPFYAKKGDIMHRFETQFEAGKALRLHKGKINQCLVGSRETTGGWYFSYEDLTDFITPNRFWGKKDEKIIEFFSKSEAAEYTGIKYRANISRCLNGKAKTSKGWRFSYVKEELV